VREIARQLGRAASTISRELRRNAATRGGALEYRAHTAQWHADRAARRPKVAKLVANPSLGKYVQDRLAGSIATPGGSDNRRAASGSERPATWTSAGTSMVTSMEPTTDRQLAADRFAERRRDAD
jgi:hypothetical protein